MKELKKAAVRGYCPVRRLKEDDQKIEEVFVGNCQFNTNSIKAKYDVFHRYNICVAPENVSFVSDFMENEHLNWRTGSIILLQCSVGMGKTTYVKKMIVKGYRILYFTNRRANRLQMLEAFGMTDKDEGKVLNSEISSYQRLERNVAMDVNYLNTFDMLVLDEAHYFLQDSLFNTKANISFRKIMQARKPRKIFMSATLMDIKSNVLFPFSNMDDVTRMNTLFYYEMKANRQIIRNIKKMPNDESMIDEVVMIKGKTIIFVDSKEKGRDLKREFDLRQVESTFYAVKTPQIQMLQVKLISILLRIKIFKKRYSSVRRYLTMEWTS